MLTNTVALGGVSWEDFILKPDGKCWQGHSAVGQWTVDLKPIEIWAIAVVTTQTYSFCVQKNKLPLQLEFVLLVERGKSPFAAVILCQRVFIPDELSHVGLVEHYDGHGIYSPTILRGLCRHTKTLRRETVLKKKKTAQRGFCFRTLNNRGAVAILCKKYDMQVQQQ